MAVIIRDSFDFYATSADAGANFWDQVAPLSLSSTTTRMGVGQSLLMGGGNRETVLTKSFGNVNTVFTAFAMRPTTFFDQSITNGYDFILQYYDGTTAQLSVVFRAQGSIEVWRGALATLLQRWDNTNAANVWTHWQIKCVFDGAAGSVHIRKNGNPSDDFAITNINSITSGVTQANKLLFINGETAGKTLQRFIDDLCIWDNTGSAPWNDWIGDVRAIQVMPSADTAQKQFTASPTTLLAGSNGTGNTTNLNAGDLVFTQWKAGVGGPLGTSITAHFRSAVTANVVIGLYDSDGPNGQPGTLLAYSTPVTNPVAGDNTFTLGTSVTLKAGHIYYWMFESSASSGQFELDTLANVQYYTYHGGYTATPPANMSAFSLASSTNHSPTIWGTITATNSGCVGELIENGSTTYVSDSNVGYFDLYSTDGLPSTPYAILGVSVRAFVAKSDAGTRSGAVTIKSGSTSQDSSPLVLSTSFLNLVMYQDTDPATGVGWTESGINAAQLGPKVQA